MSSTLARTVLSVIAGFAVLLGSFWITLAVLNYRAKAVDPDANLIQIAEATYGANCQSGVVFGRTVPLIKNGNATGPISETCTNSLDMCSFVVDVNQLGDPASGCSKDLSISWRCGADKTVHVLHVAPEAHGQRVFISCPAN